MKFKEAESMSPLELAAYVVRLRYEGMSNQNTPLGRGLNKSLKLLMTICEDEKAHPKNHWYIRYYDKDGTSANAYDFTPEQRERISRLVASGYMHGQIGINADTENKCCFCRNSGCRNADS